MSDLVFAIKFIFSNAWAFFTEIEVPGTNFTFAALFLGIFLISLSIKILFWAFSGHSSDKGNGD